MTELNSDLAGLAISKLEGGDFERLAQLFAAGIFGEEFAATGGMHDGGLDGYFGTNKTYFYQFSVRKDPRAKIRDTIKRIIETRGSISTLEYWTNIVVDDSDLLERKISDSNNIRLIIRDINWLKSNALKNVQTIDAVKLVALPKLNYLKSFGTSLQLKTSRSDINPEAYVFLSQEVERIRGRDSLVVSVIDGLIKWALEGTDPDTGVLMTHADIAERILEAFPNVDHLIKDRLNMRLGSMSSKNYVGGRAIRHHTKEKAYCLPFETRRLIEAESIEDATISNNFELKLNELVQRFADADDLPVGALCNQISEIIHAGFERHGLAIMNYLNGKDIDDVAFDYTPYIDDVINKIENGDLAIKTERAIKSVIKEVIYNPNDAITLYLMRICHAYVLTIALYENPKVFEYFDGMARNMKLYVGTDIIVRMMSEVSLQSNIRGTEALLDRISAAGANLFLTETVLDEVWHHIRTVNNEYLDRYVELEQFLNPEIAENVDRMLIRSYFYGRLNAQKDDLRLDWPEFVGKYLDYSRLNTVEGKQQIKDYLVNRFGFKYCSKRSMKKGIDAAELAELSKNISDDKRGDIKLAENDALMILMIIYIREKDEEAPGLNQMGFRSWWVTQEARILRHTTEYVAETGRFILRPEFLFEYLALAGELSAVKNRVRRLLPSAIGVRLSRRAGSDLVKSTIDRYKDLKESEPERAASKMNSLARELQAARIGRS